ncbi:MAG: sulfatase-like hydrolase/transferase [Akkermansiaceae bacterium]|jgi:arylsulfatase A|nr:sulfatase-like hydrolase/transferase [Akkermansiaceae bacterium]
MKHVLAAAWLLLPLPLLHAGGTPKPNIILIMADDLGYECITANGGSSYKTPHIDQLAATGIRFEHCYAQPLCTPSRVQLMTGIYNVRNYTRFGRMDRGQTTFANLLKKQGYATCVAGKWQLGDEVDSPRHFGFDESCLWQHTRGRGSGADTRHVNPRLEINGKPVDYTNGEFGPDVINEFVRQFIGQNKDKPFFIHYPMILPHCPFVPTPGSPDYDPKSKGSPTYKGDPRYFGEMVTYMDRMVGRVIAQLEVHGVRENTLVIFTGDNGTDQPVVSMLNGKPVAGGKGQPTDAGTRVPLIVNWPGVAPKGVVSRDLVDFSDFLPTLCEATGTEVPGELEIDGRSFLPQLRGEKGHPRKWVYSWYHKNGGPKAEHEWTRNQRYKLYSTGEFHDITRDVLEKTPITEPTPDELRIRGDLQKALDRFKDARPHGSPA